MVFLQRFVEDQRVTKWVLLLVLVGGSLESELGPPLSSGRRSSNVLSFETRNTSRV